MPEKDTEMNQAHVDILKIGRWLFLFIIFLMIAPSIQAQQNKRIIFLHHSCGSNLIAEGNVREGLSALGYEFYDHGYNGDGLCIADGECLGTNFDVPGDNTDPDGLATIFSQPLNVEPNNTFSYLMQYDVIMFKSCFPTSNIGSDGQLEDFKAYYLVIRDRMDQYPEKLFIVVTQPPQVPGSSNNAEASRARQLAEWLSSDMFLAEHPNVFTFDFFDYLAAEDNFLRIEYRVDNQDAHPNNQANREIGPEFVSFIDEAIRSFQPDEEISAVTPKPSPEAPMTTVPPLTMDDGDETHDDLVDEPDQGEQLEQTTQTGSPDSGGTGGFPCPGMTVPFLMVAVVLKGNHNRHYMHRQGESK